MTATKPAATDQPPPKRFVFWLMPNYSMIAFTNAVETLRMANRLAGKMLYEWRIVSLHGEQVTASNGLEINGQGALFEQTRPRDVVIVCGGVDVDRVVDKDVIAGMKQLARDKHIIGALCTGTYVLAHAGLLDGYRCTIHWENLASLRDQFPNAIISAELFEIDRDRYTSTGGTAPLDMFLTLIREHHGQALAAAISEEFVCERIRGKNDKQRVPLRHQLGTSQPKLVEAVSLMESNLEEPMSLDELASCVGLSRRQLERLFQRHLQCVPTRYYLELRLNRARQLLLQTSKSIVDIAFACGFVSAPHFSKCYRDFFGVPPRDERRLRAASLDQPPQTKTAAPFTPDNLH